MLRALCGLALVLPILSLQAMAQTSVTGALGGVITDASGAVVPGASLVMKNESTGTTRVTTSEADGRYSFPLLSPGLYQVEVSASGFKSEVRPGIQIVVTETARLNVAMDVGAATEVVNVTADQQLVQTDTSALGRVVGAKEITSLPLVTRNYTQILGLSPGVNMPVTNAGDLGRGSSSSSGGANGVKIVNGARPTDNNFQLNGIPVNDNFASGSGGAFGASDTGGGVPVPNPDTIEEFKVQTAQYDATFGRNAGGNVNIVTKTGSAAFHGNVFEYFRNEALNANGFFQNRNGQPRQVLRQNQFGFDLGGPLWEPRLEFFTSYQGTRQTNGVASGCSAVYTGPPLTNDRSAAALGALFAGQSGVFGGEAINSNGSNINPIALAAMSLKLPNGQYLIPTPQTVNTALPFPVQGTSSFSIPCTFSEDQFVTNVQYQTSEKSTFAARYFQATSDQTVSLGTSNVPGISAPSSAKFQNFSLTHTFILTQHLVNQFVGGYNGIDANQPAGRSATNAPFDWGKLGANAPSDFGPSELIIPGGVTAAEQAPIDVRQPAFSLADSVSYTKGAHNLRLGGGLNRDYITVSKATGGVNLIFLSYPDFLLGLPGGAASAGGNGSPFSNLFLSFGGAYDSERKYRKLEGSLFLQDDYKVSSNITLNLGFRYDRLPVLSEALGRASTFNRAAADPNAPTSGSLNGFVVAHNYPGTPPAGVVKTNHDYAIDGDGQNSWAPRVGFSWLLFPKGAQVLLRGGFGIYSSQPAGIGTFVGVVSPPWLYNASTQGTANPQISLQSPFGPGPFPTLSQLPLFVPYTPTAPVGQLQYQNVHYRPGYVDEFTLNTQTDLGHDFLLEVAYVGAHGVHLSRGRLPNEAGIASAASPIRGITTNTVSNIAQRVPILGFTPTALVENETGGQSWYNGLEASLTKRLSHGLQMLVSYTWSKNLDTDAPDVTQADQGTANDAYGDDNDPRRRYGRTNFDRTHRFVVSYTYDLPQLKHANSLARTALNGWQLAGVTTYQTGTALTATASNGRNVAGATNDFAPLSGSCAKGQFVSRGSVENKLNSYLSSSCFSIDPATRAPVYPVVGTDGVATGFGNSGVGIADGPGQRNWDVSLTKHSRVPWPTETSNIEFRTELFNAFNTPQFSNPDTNLSDATFGEITSTSVNPRILQLALRFNF